MNTKTISTIPNKIKEKIEKNGKRTSENYFKGVQMNIRNIRKNIELFRIMVEQTKIEYDFIGLTECWADEEEIEEMNIDINGYENVHSKMKFNQNGGVHMYINRKLKWKQRSENEIDEADSVEAEIHGQTKKDTKVIIVIYRNPGRNIEKFIESMVNKLKGKYYKERNTIIIGDFNIDLEKKNRMTDLLLDKMSEVGFQQVIKENTRITEKMSSRIDLCFTNQIQK